MAFHDMTDDVLQRKQLSFLHSLLSVSYCAATKQIHRYDLTGVSASYPLQQSLGFIALKRYKRSFLLFLLLFLHQQGLLSGKLVQYSGKKYIDTSSRQ